MRRRVKWKEIDSTAATNFTDEKPNSDFGVHTIKWLEQVYRNLWWSCHLHCDAKIMDVFSSHRLSFSSYSFRPLGCSIACTTMQEATEHCLLNKNNIQIKWKMNAEFYVYRSRLSNSKWILFYAFVFVCESSVEDITVIDNERPDVCLLP